MYYQPETSINFDNYYEKMEKNELTIEDILDEDELIQDLSENPESKFLPFLTNEVMIKLIDYSLKMPTEDDPKKGHKFPFNATEIICSSNSVITDKFFENNEKKKQIEKDEKMDIEKEETKKEQNKEEKKEEEKKNEEKKMEEEKIEEKKNEENNEKIEEKKNEKDDKMEIDENNINNNEIQIEEQKEKINLLDYFFKFLENESTNENYVLIGYFNKILNHFLQKRGHQILTYIYGEKGNKIFEGLIKHLNRKLIGECLKSILTYNDDEIKDNKDINNKKKEFLEKILQDLNESEDEDKYYCICDTLKNCFSKKDFFFRFMTNKNLVSLLFSILYKNLENERGLRILFNLMIKINEKILSSFDKLITPNLIAQNQKMTLPNSNNDDDNDDSEINEESFKSAIDIIFQLLIESEFIFFQDLLFFNPNFIFETTYQQMQKILGYKKHLQIEYFRTIIDILVNSYFKKISVEKIDEIILKIGKAKIFYMLHYIFFEYPFNNLYQTFYLQLMTIVLNEHSPEKLIHVVFNENENNNFIQALLNNTISKIKFQYYSGREVNSCLLASHIKLIYDIYNSKNEFVQKIIENEKDFKVFYEVLASEVFLKFNGKLLFSEYSSFPIQLNTSNNVELSTRSIDEILINDLNIYYVYLENGDYKSLQEQKMKIIIEEEKKKNEKNQLSVSQELTSSINQNDNNINKDLENNNNEKKEEEEQKEEKQKEEDKKEEDKKEEDQKEDEKKEDEKKEEDKKDNINY